MVTDQQVRRSLIICNAEQIEYLYQAADASGMNGKTACKYLKSKKLPSQSRVKVFADLLDQHKLKDDVAENTLPAVHQTFACFFSQEAVKRVEKMYLCGFTIFFRIKYFLCWH